MLTVINLNKTKKKNLIIRKLKQKISAHIIKKTSTHITKKLKQKSEKNNQLI